MKKLSAVQIFHTAHISIKTSFAFFLIFLYLRYMTRNSLINRRFKYTQNNVVLILIAINVVMFALTKLFPRMQVYLSMIPSLIVYNKFYWQFFTYMFMHASLSHLFFNMFALWMFGTLIEKQIGSREFLLFYLLTGLLSGVASFILYYFLGQNVILLGASGAVYAILMLFAVLFPFARVLFLGFIPMRAPVLVLFYFVVEFFSQFRMDGVSHYTHLFGFLFAYLYILIRLKINPIKVFRNK